MAICESELLFELLVTSWAFFGFLSIYRLRIEFGCETGELVEPNGYSRTRFAERVRQTDDSSNSICFFSIQLLLRAEHSSIIAGQSR